MLAASPLFSSMAPSSLSSNLHKTPITEYFIDIDTLLSITYYNEVTCDQK